MIIVLLILLIILLILSIYYLKRNEKVCEFLCGLVDEGYYIVKTHLDNIPIKEIDDKTFEKYLAENERLRKIWFSIQDISYDKVLWSIKPLKPEYWLTKEQLEFLNRQK